MTPLVPAEEESEIPEIITYHRDSDRKTFSALGISFSGTNLKDLAEKSKLVNVVGGKVYPFSFVGYKFEHVIEKAEGKIPEFDSVVFLLENGDSLYSGSKPVYDMMQEFHTLVTADKERSNTQFKEDENGNILYLQKDGFFVTKLPQEVDFVFYPGAGKYQNGYCVLE